MLVINTVFKNIGSIYFSNIPDTICFIRLTHILKSFGEIIDIRHCISGLPKSVDKNIDS